MESSLNLKPATPMETSLSLKTSSWFSSLDWFTLWLLVFKFRLVSIEVDGFWLLDIAVLLMLPDCGML